MNGKLPNSLLSTLLDASPDGIVVVDREGRLVVCNRRFADLLAIPQDLIDAESGEQALRFVLSRLEQPEAFLARTRESSPEREVTREEIRCTDGRRFECLSVCCADPAGGFKGRVWHFREGASGGEDSLACAPSAASPPRTGRVSA